MSQMSNPTGPEPKQHAGHLLVQVIRAVVLVVDFVAAGILHLIVFLVNPAAFEINRYPELNKEQAANLDRRESDTSSLFRLSDPDVYDEPSDDSLKLPPENSPFWQELYDDLLSDTEDEKQTEITPPEAIAQEPAPASRKLRLMRKYLRHDSVSSSENVEPALSPRPEMESITGFEEITEETEETVAEDEIPFQTPLLEQPTAISDPSSTLQELIALFPDAKPDILQRFLIARKDVVAAAAEMYRAHLAWREATLPPDESDIARAMSVACLYVRGRTKDDTPMLVFRGGFYNNQVAPGDAYVLAAVYLLEKMVEQGLDKVTVLVNVAELPGAANAPPDIKFIRQLSSVLSDNYPERLHRLVIYPFPWIGAAVWNMVKVFLDPRTRDRIVLVSGSAARGAAIPPALYEYVAPDQLSPMLGGTDLSELNPYSVQI